MPDREKVIDWIGKCESQFIGCTLSGECPYWVDDPNVFCWDKLMHDAGELLKTDQYYLQKLTERLQDIADIAIRGLPEDWRPTENEPCKSCSNNPKNGGSGICHCTLGMPQVTC